MALPNGDGICGVGWPARGVVLVPAALRPVDREVEDEVNEVPVDAVDDVGGVDPPPELVPGGFAPGPVVPGGFPPGLVPDGGAPEPGDAGGGPESVKMVDGGVVGRNNTVLVATES